MNLLPAEAAARLRMSKGSLANLRMSGQGPAFLKIGARKVLYTEKALDAFERSRLRTSTTESGEGA
jgi:hypothetical protein